MYNSVEELHIGVDLALQNLNSNRKQVVKPEEKDWFLNTTLLQVINNHIDPNSALPERGSDSGQRVVDYLNVLKVHYKVKPVIFYDEVKGLFTTPLPADYYRKSRISATAHLNIKETDDNPKIDKGDDGNRLLKSVISFNDLAVDQSNGGANVPIAEYISKSKITVTSGTNGEGVIFNADDKSETNVTEARYNFDNIVSLGSKFMMIATILEACNAYNWVSVYWESFKGEYHSNSFIFVIDPEAHLQSTGQVITEINAVKYEINSTVYSKALKYVAGSIITGSGGKSVSCRIVESEEFKDMNDNEFLGSSYLKLNSIIENGEIVIAGSKDLKIIDVDMTYYRRPRLINYKTGQNCEIPADDFKVQLVNLTAQKINAFLEEGNYQKMLNENMLLL